MTLEDEKKLVAYRLIGRDYWIDEFGHTVYFSEWSPESERKWWPEIFGKIWEAELAVAFIERVLFYNAIKIDSSDIHFTIRMDECMMLLETNTEVLWKSLNEVLA